MTVCRCKEVDSPDFVLSVRLCSAERPVDILGLDSGADLLAVPGEFIYLHPARTRDNIHKQQSHSKMYPPV